MVLQHFDETIVIFTFIDVSFEIMTIKEKAQRSLISQKISPRNAAL